MTDVALSCTCGQVKGVAKGISPRIGNHFKCYCDDCQTYAMYLDREDCLDVDGGSEIFQMAPSRVSVTEGEAHIRCVRLSKQGIFRWYADCCKTPLGNTLSPNLPFLGVLCAFMVDSDETKQALGPITALVQTQHARNRDVNSPKGSGFPFSVKAKIIWKILGWKLLRQGQPSPFYRESGQPIAEPHILNQ